MINLIRMKLYSLQCFYLRAHTYIRAYMYIHIDIYIKYIMCIHTYIIYVTIRTLIHVRVSACMYVCI